MTKSNANIIPSNGGKNPVNELPIRTTLVILFDYKTLEIISLFHNYTTADEMGAFLYRKGIDARSDSLHFHDETLTPEKLIGMSLTQFQDFRENNPKHPLIKNS